MYRYRNSTPQQQQELLEYRRFASLPLHEPPHFSQENGLYLLTAANFEHQPILKEEGRRLTFMRELLEGVSSLADTQIFAWVILPNHYHLLARTNLTLYKSWIGRLHNGTSTRWNREDHTPGRTVWYRFVDRRIRSDRHYWATLNYIHFNPVKHGYVQQADQWPCSSIHVYLSEYGPEALHDIERRYPILDYGKKWD